MISQVKQKGFTIVELLIVIVVIAILAAISVAAYTSITARANTSAAIAAASAVKDVAETFNTANSGYPRAKSQFASGGDDAVAKLPADIVFTSTPGEVSGTVNPKAVRVTRHDNGVVVEGFTITYRDFQSGSDVSIEVGDTNSSSTVVIPNTDLI